MQLYYFLTHRMMDLSKDERIGEKTILETGCGRGGGLKWMVE